MFLKNEEFDAFTTGARDEGKTGQICEKNEACLPFFVNTTTHRQTFFVEPPIVFLMLALNR